jgi:hypothetical protein
MSMEKPESESNMNKTKTTVILLALLSLGANFAVARDWDRDRDRDWDRDDHGCQHDRHCWSAPEIDPAQAMGALALLGGTIAIVRGYRRKK